MLIVDSLPHLESFFFLLPPDEEDVYLMDTPDSIFLIPTIITDHANEAVLTHDLPALTTPSTEFPAIESVVGSGFIDLQTSEIITNGLPEIEISIGAIIPDSVHGIYEPLAASAPEVVQPEAVVGWMPGEVTDSGDNAQGSGMHIPCHLFLL